MPNDSVDKPPACADLSSYDVQSVTHSAWRLLLLFVSLFIAIRFFSFLVFTRNVIGLAVSLVWPLIAIRLIWRGKMVGYWLMLALFGLLAIGDAAYVGYHLSQIGYRPALLLTAAYYVVPKYLPTFVVSSSAATWLVLSPSSRQFVRWRKRIAGG